MTQQPPAATTSSVLCFVDSLNPAARRFCYWDQVATWADFTFEQVSVSDLRDLARTGKTRKLPRFHGFDVVVCNWDVANGGYEYGADATAW